MASPLIRSPSRRGSSRPPAFVRLQALDGVWEVASADRRRGVWPEEVGCDWDDWGSKTARFVLRREPGRSYPDLSGLTPVEIEQGAGVWEGFIDQTPVLDEHSLEVSCIGWPDHAGDDLLAKTYVHQRLADWADVRGFLDVDLSKWPQGLLPQSSDGLGIMLGGPNGTPWPTVTASGVILDLGPGNICKRVVLDVERSTGAPAAIQLYCRVGDSPGTMVAGGADTTDSSFSGTALNTIAQSSTLFSSSFATGRRYVAIFLWNGGATYTPTADDALRIRNAIVFSDAANESGNASILKASSVLTDLLPILCPAWAPDATGIDATLLNLPHLAATAPRSFREWVDAVNAPHGYVRKLERGRRFRYKPRPARPILAAGAWPGITYRDASKNATRDLYNKGLGVGTDGAGVPVAVERYAGQQAGVPGELVTSPGFPNPSFDVNIAGWTAVATPTFNLTRATATFDTAPASLNVQNISKNLAKYLYTDASVGTFKKGVAYRITVRYRSASGTHYVQLKLGAGADSSSATYPSVGNTFTSLTVVWVPKADTAAASVRLEIHAAIATGSATDYYIDSLTVELVRPTLLDRRGRVRAKVVEMPSQSVDPAVMGAFADVWLQSRMRTKASGSLDVTGTVLRDYVTGEEIRPFELGERTNELVCLLNEIDPDTGGIGRDIPITAVSATPGEENAKLSLDTPFDDFEKLVARYDLVAGQSS